MTRPYEIRLRDLLDVLHRRKALALRVFVISFALGGLVSAFVRPAYRASATVTADKTPPVVLLDQPGAAAPDLTTVVGIAAPDAPTLVALASSETVRVNAIASLAPAIGPRQAETLLKSHLRVQPVWNTDLIRISVDHRDPRVAAQAANAVTASLVGMDRDARRRWASEMRRSIQDQLVTADPRLQAAEDALAAFKVLNGDIPLTEKTVAALNRLAQLDAELVDVRLQQQEVKARIGTARARLAAQAKISPVQWVPSPLINTLEAQLAGEEVDLSGLSHQFTPKHPAVIGIQAKIAETKRRLDVELSHSLQVDQYGVDPVYQQLTQQLRQDEVGSAALDAREGALISAIGRYEDQLRRLPARELAQARLSRDATEAQEFHQILVQKLNQATVAEASIGSAIRVVDDAQVPIRPLWPRRLPLILGGFVGLVFGAAVALIKEQIDDPLKSAEHAEHVLETPVLGTIPRMNEDVHRHEHERVLAAFAESFRYLGTAVLSLGERVPRTLLVTSPGSGEGNDVVAANLAIALARAGARVWLVDGDLRHPALARPQAFDGFDEDPSGGVAGLLGADLPERELVRRTGIPNLSFLPAGTRQADPATLLGGPRMRAFLRQDREDVDMVVLAVPPVLAVADAAVLAPLAEGALLVVRVGVTPQDAASKARQQLAAAGGHILGVVATGVPFEVRGGYHDFTRYHRGQPPEIWYPGPAGGGPTSSLRAHV